MLGMYVKVFHHFFKRIQTEPAVLNVFQDLKSKISEKLDQTEDAPALPCLAGEPPKLADWLCLAASICF